MKPLIYIGMAVLILILGTILPGITDVIILETAWIAVIAFIEIKAKIDASKK